MLDELKNAKKVVGVKQSLRALEKDEVKKAFVAKDADERVVGSFKQLCQSRGIEIEYVDTMKVLGKACNIEVGSAVAAILK